MSREKPKKGKKQSKTLSSDSSSKKKKKHGSKTSGSKQSKKVSTHHKTELTALHKIVSFLFNLLFYVITIGLLLSAVLFAFNSEQAQGESLDASAMTQKIKSDVFETTVPIAESFTNFRMPILKDQLFASFDLLVPEYYEYLGSVWTEDLSPLSINEHQQKPTDDDKPLVLPIKENDEYWISIFITPRWSDGEEAPRPYSWGYQTNQFGELKFLEGTRKK